ncbi:MAG: aminoacyl-tRNA hydrolase [bacterium]|nr:aminoacyl-tRNA hydrolase [bacterium]
MILISDEAAIDDGELTFTSSRSAGPGGQHVNKVNTRVTLRFDVLDSPALSPEQKERILERLPTRISKSGILSVSSQRHRSQAANREAALERFIALLRDALEIQPERRPTRIPRRAIRRRRADKRHRARVKRERSQQDVDE